jgi:hypothetical protein
MRQTTRESLYRLVENSVLRRHRGLSARAYLQGLGASYDVLWNAYQNKNVVVDYGAERAVEAYRLHYLPHYAYMAYRGLAALPKELLRRIAAPGLRFTAVAAGPFPEVVGLVEAAAMCGIRRGHIAATIFDINVDVWETAIRESVEMAAQLMPEITVALRLRRIDLRDRAPDGVPPADVLILQNCINEVCHDGRPTQATLTLLRSVDPGGSVVVVDFNNYFAATESVSRLERWMDANGFRPLARFDPQHEERTPFGYPPVTTFYNFYGAVARPGGGYDKVREPRQHLKYSWSVWSR